MGPTVGSAVAESWAAGLELGSGVRTWRLGRNCRLLGGSTGLASCLSAETACRFGVLRAGCLFPSRALFPPPAALSKLAWERVFQSKKSWRDEILPWRGPAGMAAAVAAELRGIWHVVPGLWGLSPHVPSPARSGCARCWKAQRPPVPARLRAPAAVTGAWFTSARPSASCVPGLMQNQRVFWVLSEEFFGVLPSPQSRPHHPSLCCAPVSGIWLRPLAFEGWFCNTAVACSLISLAGCVFVGVEGIGDRQ